ncbi:MAG: SpoIIE family protein phosphatase [SAR324 cluster bacterium]|nr:SpoIIE family protein phosphatase [SAR324 cluster bacterium]
MTKTPTKAPMILIVDDVPKNIQVLAGFLKQEHYQIAFAQNGKNALELVHKISIDLILLDVMMPEMDGFEVCARLKKSPVTRDIPIIFLTGKVEPESIVEGFRAGAVDYVSKPFNREELMARVRTHLALKQALVEVQKLYKQSEEELNVASIIQRAVMRETVAVPFLSSAMVFHPLGKVSGDMVDFCLKDNQFCFFIGDVTGHGVPASLITMMIPGILDGQNEQDSAKNVVEKINRTLSHRDLEGRFITGIYATITPEGQLTVCNAGHPALIIVPADGSPLVQLSTGGMPMGIFAEESLSSYEEKNIQLHPNDRFIVYTDGITEWENAEGKPYGRNRLLSFLEKNRTSSLSTLLTDLMEHLESFSERTPCNDDYTIVGFEYLGNER